MKALTTAAAQRRHTLAQKIKNGLVILRAAPEVFRSRDVPFAYRQNSYFYYLTACTEPHTAVLLVAKNGKLQEEIFFCRKYDQKAALWDGSHLTPTTAKRQLNFSECADIAQFADIVRDKAAHSDICYSLVGDDAKLDKLLTDIARHRRNHRNADKHPAMFADVSVWLDEMRAIKDETEISLIRAACAATCEGIKAAIRTARNAKYEWEVDAALTAAYRQQNGVHAFLPIVASGANACTLHYKQNNATLKKNKLLLVDSGCERLGYAGDVTRTFPPNGVWEGNARAVYDVVLAAQQAALRAVRPGVRWATVEKTAARRLSRGLAELKLCRGTSSSILQKETYREFYPHSCGHLLGLDVHDVGNLKTDVLRPGMVVTVEPGLYLSTPDKPEWNGIGVRIEDDVLVTKNGCEVLTADAPKTPRDIRQWMNG